MDNNDFSTNIMSNSVMRFVQGEHRVKECALTIHLEIQH